MIPDRRAVTGDMLKSVYDTNNNGIVDNAETVNGYTLGISVPANAKFTDTIYDDTDIKKDINSLQIDVASKVDKIEGKSLSTNDFTTEYKTKLDGIDNNANYYILPSASSSTRGGVKIGNNISISGDIISLSKTNIIDALGYTPPTTNTTYTFTNGLVNSNGTVSNAGVRSISTGSTNGTISVNTNGTSADVAIKGLGSLAYKSSLSANDVSAIPTSQKGVANGVASLDTNGLIPTSQLPSYVDDVIEYNTKSDFPTTGQTGKIYVDKTTNLTWRWGGSSYVEISPSLALGTTSSTAFRGDYGNTAYTHAVTNKGAAFSSGLYKITTNSEGHVTATTAVTKTDITALGIPSSDTTYQSKTAASGGTDLSLVTTGEKYNWNNKTSLVIGTTSTTAAAGNHTHSYLPLSGGTMTGTLSNSLNGSWLQGSTGEKAIIKSTSAGNLHTALWSAASSNGRFQIFKYTNYMGFGYESNSNVTGGTNALDKGVFFNESGSLYPAINNNQTLGTSNNKWNNVYATTFTGDLNGIAKRSGTVWNAITQGQKWSRICFVNANNATEGSSGILSISCTRSNVVCNYVFSIVSHHSGKCSIVQLNGCNYSTVQIRGIVDSNGNMYIELYDTAYSIASGTAQTWHCSWVPLLASSITTYTAFTDGTTLPSGYTIGGSLTTYSGAGGALVAPTFVGSLSGNASTTTKLQTARTINGTSFDGSANITTANWGTARTITIGSTGKSVNGSGNVSWGLAEIGAAPVKDSDNYVKVYGASVNGTNSETITPVDLAKKDYAMGMINSATDNPWGEKVWNHIISMNWSKGVTGSWVSQIALGSQKGTGMFYRTTSGNVSGRAWTRVLDSSNYSSYVPVTHSGTSVPDNSLGKNGDIYVLVES